MATSLSLSITRAMLAAIPHGIVLTENQRIEWINQALAEVLGGNPEQWIGLDSDSVAHPILTAIFGEETRFQVRDGLGEQRWFEQQCISLEHGTTRVHILTEVSHEVELEMELQRLEKDYKEIQTNHPVTGLLNRKGILQALDTQVTRSRRYENPLSLLRFTMKFRRPERDAAELMKSISQLLKDQLRWADQIGMIDDCTFLILLPETSLNAACTLAAKLLTERTDLAEHPEEWNISIGVAAWQKGDDQRKLLNRLQVDQALVPTIAAS